MRLGRELMPPPCPKCKNTGLIRPEQSTERVHLLDVNEIGYVKCDVCGGEGSIWPKDIDKSKL